MTDTPTLGVAELTRQIASTRKAVETGEKAWRAERASLERRLETLLSQRRIANAGVSPTDQAAAEAILAIRGSVLESAEGAFEAAVDELAAGGQKMQTRYIGAKRYDGFHQRCDCDYGYGPSHGSIVFSVGLTQERLQRPLPLDEFERDVAVRYLLALRDAKRREAEEKRRAAW